MKAIEAPPSDVPGERLRTIVRAVLDGRGGPPRDIVLLNAGAALFVAGRVESVRAGIARAAKAIDNGAARLTLDAMASGSRAEAGV